MEKPITRKGVSLSADGNIVAIGAHLNDGNGRDSGHARIYQRNSATNAWEQAGTDIDGEADFNSSDTASPFG